MSHDELPLDEDLLDTLGEIDDFDATTRLDETMARADSEFSDVPTTGSLEFPSDLSEEPSLKLQKLLASGGLAYIFEALQAPFERSVAVKCLRPDRANADGPELLFREGVLTGLLDHPNIVPVYDIAGEPSGDNGIVMKRIVGRSLRRIRDATPLFEDSTAEFDQLRKYLEILIDVCHALEYAHSQNVIHRDLKPQNIMVGDYGEVYLIDWGLGMYVGDGEPPGGVGERTESSDLGGTPAYMAPEMIEGDPAELTPKTDQFLLGGVLHFIVTGESPYSGGEPRDVLDRAFQSAPKSYSESVPSELAAIIRRSMERDPSDRFPDIAAFRAAIEDFLEHQDSRKLVQRAESITDELRERVSSQESEGGDREEFGEIYRLIGEARFGFQEALDRWEDNEAAKEGLQELLELGTRWTLDRQLPEAASMFLSEMFETSPELAEEVRELEGRVDQFRTESLFFEESPNALAVVENGTINYVNRRLGEMFGYEADELIGEPIEMLIPDQLHERHRDHRRNYMEAPTARPMGTDLELRGQQKDGTEFPVDVELNPVESGERTLVMASVRRRDADQRARLSSPTLTARAVLRNLPHAVFAESEGRIVFANSKSVELLEVDNVESLLDEPLDEFLDPVDNGDSSLTRGALIAAGGVRHPVRLSIDAVHFEGLDADGEDCRIVVAELLGEGPESS